MVSGLCDGELAGVRPAEPWVLAVHIPASLTRAQDTEAAPLEGGREGRGLE